MIKNRLKHLGGFSLSFCMELYHLVQRNIPGAAVFIPDYTDFTLAHKELEYFHLP